MTATTLSRRGFVAAAAGLPPGLHGTSRAAPDPVRAHDTVNGTFPLNPEKVTLRVLVLANALVEDYPSNDFTAWYEDKTNVHVEWEVVAATEAQTNLNIRLASGDFPDVIFGFNLAPQRQLLDGVQGVFRSLNDLIDQYGIETRRVFAEFPLAKRVVTAPDGSIYSLPAIAGCFHCARPYKLWIYRPWLDRLGLEMPTTTEEFAQVLAAFKASDPNGDGKEDEIPLASATSGTQPLDPFFLNAFLYNPGERWLTLVNDTVTAAFAQPAWRDGVAYLAGLGAQGLIPSETFTQNGDQLRQSSENTDAPLLGSVPALAPSTFITVDQANGGRWTDYVAVPPLTGPAGIRQTAFDPYQGFLTGAFLITSACALPEIAFRWADGLYDLETSMRAVEGVPGVHWRWAEPGEIGNNGEPAVWQRLYSYGQSQNFTWAQTGVYYRPEWLHSGLVLDPATANRNQPSILYRETKEKYTPYDQPAEWTLPPLFFTVNQAQLIADVATTINDYVKQTFAGAVTGELDLVAGWDDYLATLDSMGLARYLQAYQDAYDALRG